MTLSQTLTSALEKSLGTTIQATHSVGGGDINEAARLKTTKGAFFVKWHRRAPDGMFEKEARGLNLLREQTPLRVPEVIAFEHETDEHPAFLALEWLETGRAIARTDEDLGTGLATLHQTHADQHGLDHDNYIGSLPQSNTPVDDWPTFFGEQRIRPQMEEARRRGKLSGTLETQLENLIDTLPDLVPNAEPSLLHGDLWRGNVMILSGGKPAIIDPAVYYGHREIELAFTELFGGFTGQFYDAYSAVYPIENGYHERKTLYQLYPLMVHMNLFGGTYTMRVQSILDRYVS